MCNTFVNCLLDLSAALALFLVPNPDRAVSTRDLAPDISLDLQCEDSNLLLQGLEICQALCSVVGLYLSAAREQIPTLYIGRSASKKRTLGAWLRPCIPA